jgi:N-methylhydantoinase B
VADHWLLDHETGDVQQHLENMGETTCTSYQEWYAVTGGGGGLGNPLERDPKKVRDDARDGFITLEAARTKYGVVLDTKPECYAVDYPETEALRKSIAT